jgi:hypothetical protein
MVFPSLALPAPVASSGLGWATYAPGEGWGCFDTSTQPPSIEGLLQLPLGRVGLGRADDEAFFEAVGAFGPTEPIAPCARLLATVDGVARQLQRLELEVGGRGAFLGKLFLQPGQAILGPLQPWSRRGLRLYLRRRPWRDVALGSALLA